MNDMRHGEAATNAIQLEKLIEKQILNKISIPTDHKTPSSKGSWLSDNGKEDIVDEVVGERESQTEVALATLNAEMHKNMSKMAKAVADAAGKSAAAMTKPVSIKETKEKENGEEERRKELMTKMAKE
uniref:Uncharacterized protein n=1 Tax=Brassica oleracea var. oleracea TaxID=109376 RepID=A0A0D3DLH8_BRAOL